MGGGEFVDEGVEVEFVVLTENEVMKEPDNEELGRAIERVVCRFDEETPVIDTVSVILWACEGPSRSVRRISDGGRRRNLH